MGTDGKLGVGIVGLGWVSGEHVKAWRANPRCEVVALCSHSRENALGVQERHGLTGARVYTDWDEMVRDERVDVVDVCSVNSLHAPQGVAAAEAGKHVLIEKPAAIDLAGLRRLEAAVARANVKSLVGFELRWNPYFESVRAMIEADFFGRVYYAECDYFMSGLEKWYAGYDWIKTREKGGTALTAAGCHGVDSLRQCVRSEAVEVHAYAGNYTGVMEWDATITMLIRFADGAIGKMACSIEGNIPYEYNLRLHGDRGTLVNDRFLTHHLPGQTGWAQFPTIMPTNPDVANFPFKSEIDHLVDCIVEDRTPVVDIADAVKTFELIFGAEQSAREGRPVALPLPR